VLLLTLLAFLKARTPIDNDRFSELKAQVNNDLRALREAAK
jgi:hypothetical protein